MKSAAALVALLFSVLALAGCTASDPDSIAATAVDRFEADSGIDGGLRAMTMTMEMSGSEPGFEMSMAMAMDLEFLHGDGFEMAAHFTEMTVDGEDMMSEVGDARITATCNPQTIEISITGLGEEDGTFPVDNTMGTCLGEVDEADAERFMEEIEATAGNGFASVALGGLDMTNMPEMTLVSARQDGSAVVAVYEVDMDGETQEFEIRIVDGRFQRMVMEFDEAGFEARMVVEYTYGVRS